MIDEIILAAEKKASEKKTDVVLECEIELFADVNLRLPEEFVQLTAEEARNRYPSESRPEAIFANSSRNINFAFNLLDLKNADLRFYLSKFITSIKLVYPNTLIYDESDLLSEHDGHNIRYFEFRTSSLEGAIYNIMYLVSDGKRMLLGTFNCPFEEYQEWRNLAFSVIKTTRFK